MVSKTEFEVMVTDPYVSTLLDDLEVEEDNRSDLFDVLDADGNGKLQIGELVVGLMKLRGPARKSDVIAVRLMLRDFQKTFRDFQMDLFDALDLSFSEMLS